MQKYLLQEWPLIYFFFLWQKSISIHIPNAPARNYLNIFFCLFYAVVAKDVKGLSAFQSKLQHMTIQLNSKCHDSHNYSKYGLKEYLLTQNSLFLKLADNFKCWVLCTFQVQGTWKRMWEVVEIKPLCHSFYHGLCKPFTEKEENSTEPWAL